MYNLGEQFKFNLNLASANPDSIITGEKFRITVITERVVRLEYNENGIFENNPTQLIWYRNFPKPNFEVKQNNNVIVISTKYFELTYVKNKNFLGTKLSPTSNLKIALKNTDKVWYYKHPEIRNYGASAYKIQNDIKKMKGLYSSYGFASIDDSKSSVILENGAFKNRTESEIDIYVFMYDKDFFYALNDYFLLTGYPPLIPRYALGNWWDKNEFYGEYDISHLIKKFEDKNIPISLFTLNNWQLDNNFEFNSNYKSPQMLSTYFHNKRIKLGLSIEDPLIFKQKSKCFDKLEAYLPKDKKGNIPFNLYDQKTIDAFLKLIISPITNYGIDYFALKSFNYNTLDRTMILKHYLYYNNKINNKRPFISAYNGTIASHRYPVLYAGKSTVSWNSLKSIPSFNASASNIGVSFWSHDFGGTIGGVEDNELFIRYVELGVFSPILRLGSEAGKYYKREPWKWDIKTTKIVTDYLNLRYKLIPYIYTESYKYHKYGKPLIEPIYYRYPVLFDDIHYADEYFFGNDIFVSPITSKKDYIMDRVIHKLYLPSGVWYDFFTGKKYLGNRKYISFYRDEEYPVFVRAGAIIPMSLNVGNDTSAPKKMEIQVFPGASNTYSIYEDDGETNNYLNGEYIITNIEFIYNKDNYKLTILPVNGKTSVIPNERSYKIRFKNTNPASRVEAYIGGTQIKNKCYKDNTDFIIEFENIPTNTQVTVICSGNNIEIDDIRIVKEDIIEIISDLPIKTIHKQKVDDIMFSTKYDIKKKRIEIKKLANGKEFLPRKYIDLFLRLLDYINQV